MCFICREQKRLLPTSNDCWHETCDPCLRAYVLSQYKDISKYPLRCAHGDCGKELSRQRVGGILTSKEIKHFDKWDVYSSIAVAQRLVCSGCDNVLIKGGFRRSVFCPLCCKKICSECGLDGHGSSECISEVDSKMNALIAADENYQWCPRCETPVERSRGCNHMTHHSCPNPTEPDKGRTDFCICCGVILLPDHYRFALGDEKNRNDHFPGPRGFFSLCKEKGNYELPVQEPQEQENEEEEPEEEPQEPVNEDEEEEEESWDSDEI